MKTVTFNLSDGPILLQEREGLIHAQGIPYARADRFERPGPIPPWVAPQEALRPGPQSLQPTPESLGFIGDHPRAAEESEECLTLEILGPKPHGQLRPVMVWVHGGSYLFGYGGTRVYDSSRLVREGDVIVVHVNYRLGLLGFQRMEGISPANLGLLDIMAALEWVQRNISAMGGDPRRVTVFGQSAGADAVSRLLLADGTEHLFARAILQSMPMGLTSRRDAMMTLLRAEAERLISSAEHAKNLGREEILKIQQQVMTSGAPFDLKALMPFIPEPGEPPLPPEKEWMERIRRRAPNRDLLIQFTRDEMLLFLWDHPNYREAAKSPRLRETLTQGTTYESIAKDSIQLFNHHLAGGGRAILYRFDWSAPESRYGAAHGIDIPFLFENEEKMGGSPSLKGSTPADRAALAKAMRKRWTEFAHRGLSEGIPPEIHPI